MKLRNIFSTLVILILTGVAGSVLAQQVIIADEGLDAAIRDALQKPTGPLTTQDLLTLTNLNASDRSIFSLDGLEAASNLISLDLSSNFLPNVSFPSTLTKLTTVDLSFQFNAFRNCSFPDSLTNLSRVLIKTCALTNITLPNGLVSLVELNLSGNQLTNLSLPPSLRAVGSLGLSNNRLQGAGFLTNLTELNNLDLDDNRLPAFVLPSRLTNISFISLRFNFFFTNFSLPNGLSNLDTLRVDANGLVTLALPSGLTRLVELSAGGNGFSNLILPADATNLVTLNLPFNSLTNVSFPQELRTLVTLDLERNEMSSFVLPPQLTRLQSLDLNGNQLTNLVVPAGLTNLTTLDASLNQLRSLALSPSLPKLTSLDLGENQLVSLELPPGMTNLQGLFLADNQLTNLSLPPDLSALTTLVLANNQITTLTLPAGLTSLTTLVLGGNPLASLALSQEEAANLAQTVSALRAQGVTIVILANSNSPPTVTITSPINGASFIAPATITIQADASDSDGSITNVQFFDGESSLGNVSSSPYNLSVSLAAGVHPLIVVASDDLGAITASLATVTVIATNAPPTVAITSPINGSSFIAPATITIQADASDSDGSITNVQFFDGVTSLGNVSSSPYNLSVSLAVGSHALFAIASDNRSSTTATLVKVTGLTEILISEVTNLTEGTFQFTFTNTPGASFTVLTSTNLATPVDKWTGAGAALETTPGIYQFTDETTNSPQRFYRIRSP